MLPIPGKTCGPCTMCCKSLEIEFFKKPAGDWCAFCIKTGGCANYVNRPKICREFECSWMMERAMPAHLRPDKVGTIIMEDPDSDEYRAVCDPSTPHAWRNPLVMKHLIATAKTGRTVVARAGLKAWRIYASGHVTPTE